MMTFQEIADAIAAGTDTEQHATDFFELEIMMTKLCGASSVITHPGWQNIPQDWRINARRPQQIKT